MGWGFVPLTKYQGGGAEAVLEPLNDHLKDYEMLMMQYYGAGIQACYRGPRLYDTDATKNLVSTTIAWYKKYRNILNSSIVHLRRADGRDWDGFMHVNPSLNEKGFLMVFNPTDQPIKKIISIPLYYTGLKNTVSICEKDLLKQVKTIEASNQIKFEITVPANSYNWYVLKK